MLVSEPLLAIQRFSKFREEMRRRKILTSLPKIKLGDYVNLVNIDPANNIRKRDIYVNIRTHRCISVNPNVVIQRLVNDELTEIIVLTNEQVESAEVCSKYVNWSWTICVEK